MEKYYLGLDQGTTGTTALIFDSQWNQIARGYKEHTQYYPKPGWVEHDPMEIWNSILETIAMAAEEAGIQVADLTCMGLDNQGETVMLWDRYTGVPVYNAIVWQDRRTAKMADELAEKYGDLIRERTGLVADAYFSATKIRWIMDHVEGVREKIENGHVIAGTLDTWMIWKLTHGHVHVTDYSTASRTMLLNIHTGEWLRDKLHLIASAAETEDLAKSVPDTGGVYFVPAFAGLAAPHWDQYARGTIVGITGGTTKEQLVRATLESIAYQVKDNLDVMVKDSGIPIEVMRVDGGAVVNEFLMQFQADILGIPVDVPVITDTTGLGAAYLAAYGIGEFHDLSELEHNWKLYKRYEPHMEESVRAELLRNWHRAVERAKSWAEK